jgi:hypothetical protein
MPAVNDKYCSAYLTPLVLRTLIAGERRSSAARANPHPRTKHGLSSFAPTISTLRRMAACGKLWQPAFNRCYDKMVRVREPL